MSKKLCLIATLVLVCASRAFGQPPLWTHTYGGGSDDLGQSVAVGMDGTIYVAGETWSISGTGDPGLLIQAYAPDGTLNWTRVYDWGTSHCFSRISVHPSGDLLICGGTNDNSDAILGRFSPVGDFIWCKMWNNSWEDYNDAPLVGSTGDVFVCAQTVSGGIDACLSRYDPNGVRLWTRSWNRRVNDAGSAIASGPAGTLYVAGQSGEWAAQLDQDAYLTKWDESGNLIWDVSWSAAREFLVDVIVVGNDVYACGSISGYGEGQDDVLILKFDGDGNLQWAKTWGGAGTEIGLGIAFTPEGLVLVTGSTDSFGSGGSDLLLLTLDATGSLLDAQTWGTSGEESANTLLTSGSRAYVAGRSPSISGLWQQAAGVVGDPVGTVGMNQGTVVSVGGTDSDVALTEGSISGVLDVGGGGGDALLMAFGPECVEVFPCLYVATDVNCDGFTDAVDVAITIDATFFGLPEPPPCCPYTD